MKSHQIINSYSSGNPLFNFLIEKKIRMVNRNGITWIVSADFLREIGYAKNSRQGAIQRFCLEKSMQTIPSKSGGQGRKLTCIRAEDALHILIRSAMPQALNLRMELMGLVLELLNTNSMIKSTDH